MLRLSSALTETLLNKPESGMGYQAVEAVLTDNRKKQGIVYNADLLVFDDDSSQELRTKGYARLVQAANSSAGKVKSLQVRSRGPATAGAVKEFAYARRAQPAKDAPKEKTAISEVFKRFSAYPNDHRVGRDRSLLPGSYATTEEDAKNVKTGRDAVARYALPNPDPASYVLTIRPHGGTTIQRGIVEPANGQPGGGVEVIFADGTQSYTVEGPVTIPDG